MTFYTLTHGKRGLVAQIRAGRPPLGHHQLGRVVCAIGAWETGCVWWAVKITELCLYLGSSGGIRQPFLSVCLL